MEKINDRKNGVLLLNGRDACAYLSISRTLFTSLVNKGEIPYVTIGSDKRYRKSDLDNFARPKSFLEKIMQPLVKEIRKEYYGYGTNSVSFPGKKNRH